MTIAWGPRLCHLCRKRGETVKAIFGKGRLIVHEQTQLADLAQQAETQAPRKGVAITPTGASRRAATFKPGRRRARVEVGMSIAWLSMQAHRGPRPLQFGRSLGQQGPRPLWSAELWADAWVRPL